jgi:hypothetical protein
MNTPIRLLELLQNTCKTAGVQSRRRGDLHSGSSPSLGAKVGDAELSVMLVPCRLILVNTVLDNSQEFVGLHKNRVAAVVFELTTSEL